MSTFAESPELVRVETLKTYLLADPERATDMWCSVFGSAGESWEWWLDVRFVEGDWDVPGVVHLEIENPDDEMGMPVSKDVRLDDVAEAFATAVVRGYRDTCTGKPISADDVDAGLDACSSDVILQLLVLGEVVYG